ncbi:hypothetical protein ACF3NR_07940 [Vaginella massiliensis]|uniref:hypothetical protein n=1 Tax=Vaginella massiliensis TaxID=1816680 RepID=UPI00374FF234
MGLRSRWRELLSDAAGDSNNISQRLEGLRLEFSKLAIDLAIEGINLSQKALNRLDKTTIEVIDETKERVEKVKDEIKEETKTICEVSKEQYQKTKDYIHDKLKEEANADTSKDEKPLANAIGEIVENVKNHSKKGDQNSKNQN